MCLYIIIYYNILYANLPIKIIIYVLTVCIFLNFLPMVVVYFIVFLMGKSMEYLEDIN